MGVKSTVFRNNDSLRVSSTIIVWNCSWFIYECIIFFIHPVLCPYSVEWSQSADKVYRRSLKCCIVGRKRAQIWALSVPQCIKFAPFSFPQCNILRISDKPYDRSYNTMYQSRVCPEQEQESNKNIHAILCANKVISARPILTSMLLQQDRRVR